MNTCRAPGGPIPWDKIVLYAHYEQFDDDLTRTFVKVIRQLDAAYMKWQREEQEKKANG